MAQALAAGDRDKRVARQDVFSFLIMPVQRVPRYVMLVAELLKQTPAEHRDCAPLREASEQIKRTAELINQRKREAENAEVLLGIASKLTPEVELVQAHRFVVCRGVLMDFGDSKHPNGKGVGPFCLRIA